MQDAYYIISVFKANPTDNFVNQFIEQSRTCVQDTLWYIINNRYSGRQRRVSGIYKYTVIYSYYSMDHERRGGEGVIN